MKKILTLAAAVVAVTIGLGYAQTRPADGVVEVEMPLKFPAVGNIDLVRQWRFGHLQDVQTSVGDDIILHIRTAGGVVQITGPGPQLSELAFRSNWVRSPSRQFPGRQDWMERMIAFDYDENRRLIAMASLEPLPRDRNRLRRALV